MPQKGKLNLPEGTVVPNHIAIVLDGNRRWARARGLPDTDGHKAGYKAMKEVVKASRDLGIHTLTVWGFSTENWERPKRETLDIMNLVRKFLSDFEDEYQKEGVRLIHLGRKDRLPKDILKYIGSLEARSKNNNKHILNVALDYGGRNEIIRAVKRIIADNVKESEISEELFSSYLDTADQPYPCPDLFVRTSGEQRTSGLLPWQTAYTEYYWEQDHLPDFSAEKLRNIILDYSRRRRRFGKNDAVAHLKFKPELTAKLELNWWRLSKIPEDKSFRQYAYEHVAEQWGLSKTLTKEAAKLMAEALVEGKRSKWSKATLKMKKFYKLIKDEVKLALEPSIAASLEIKILQKINGGSHVISQSEVEDVAQDLIAEVYRISDFQAKKAAHLRALATVERNLAEIGEGEEHWQKAEEYLKLYYKALKDRVA
jgi:undecaprenyl diphosphate synthase